MLPHRGTGATLVDRDSRTKPGWESLERQKMLASETFQGLLLFVIGLVCTGLVPWAAVMERRTSRIEAKLSAGTEAITTRINRIEVSQDRQAQKREEMESQLERRIHDLENRIHEVELKCQNPNHS